MSYGQRFIRKRAAPLAFDEKNHRVSIPDGDYPFSGQLLDGKQAARWLIDALSLAKQPVALCSAFLRSDALQAIFPQNRARIQGRILVRWQLGDLQVGASDLEAYRVAMRLGLDFHIRLDFHGKVFSVPDVGAVVGSANATFAGFGMKGVANAEICTLVPALASNLSLIDGLFQSATRIDDELYEEIGDALRLAPTGGSEFKQWPKELMRKLQPPVCVSHLFTSECLSSSPILNEAGLWIVPKERDRDLLGLLDAPIKIGSLTAAFMSLKIYHWLEESLARSAGELYFGSLSVALHNALLDDPGIYRRDVKDMLQVLLAWCALLVDCGMEVDQPNHSQRIRHKLK